MPVSSEYVAVDLTATNAHIYRGRVVDLGWGVCRQGHGLQAFGDGHMTEQVARDRAAALNAGSVGTTVPNH